MYIFFACAYMFMYMYIVTLCIEHEHVCTTIVGAALGEHMYT